MEELEKKLLELEEKIKKLEESNFLYQSIFEKLPFGLQLFDKNGLSFKINPAQKEMLGMPDLDEGIGNFNVLTDPFSKSTGANKIYEEAYKGKEFTHEFEYNLGIEENKWKTRKDARFFSETIIPIKNLDGEIIYVLAILDDRTKIKNAETALKNKEEQFELAMDATNDGLWDWNLITNEIFFSPAWKRMLGYNDNELSNEFSVWERLTEPNDVKKAWELLELHIAGKTERFDVEFKMKHKDGHWVDIRSRANAYFDEKGNAYRVVGTHVDITDWKEKEKQLNDLNATKDKFFSIIAHDLRSPFSSILGFSELALNDSKIKKFDKTEYYCTHIYNATQQSFNLLNNLLQWSRLQMGKIEFYPKNINLNEIITDILSLINVNIKEKQLRVNIQIKPDMTVFADSFMMDTVLRNLIANAIKYSHIGGEIEINASASEKELKISVIDNGIGIEKENLDKLFKIDSNFIMPGTKNEKGTGLGLILCKEFIDLHKGKIWAESDLGNGSSFIFTIPAKN